MIAAPRWTAHSICHGIGMKCPRNNRLGNFVSDTLSVTQILRFCLQDCLWRTEDLQKSSLHVRGRRAGAMFNATKASVSVIMRAISAM